MAINDITRSMGPSSNQSHTSQAVGHAEDLSPIVTRIDPDYSFYTTEFETGDAAESLRFGWPLSHLEPPKVNAHKEKEDYTTKEVGSMEYKENHIQFLKSYGYVTHAQRKVKKAYNPQDEYTRLLEDALIQHARDTEYAITNNAVSYGESGAGDNITPAMTGGVPFFMQTESLNCTVTANTGVVTTTAAHKLKTGDFVYFTATTMPTGLDAQKMYYVRLDTTTPATVFTIFDSMKGAVENIEALQVKPTTAGTSVKIVLNNVIDLGYAADFTLDDIDSVMQMCYNRGGNPTLAVMSPAKKRRFSSLVTALATINRNMTKSRKVDLVADTVETDFGMIQVKPHRVMDDSSVYLMDMQYWKHRWFDPVHQVNNLPKIGTYDRFVIESAYGLESTQPKASGAIIGVKR